METTWIRTSSNIIGSSNFVGEKLVRRVVMQPGVDVEVSKAQKDELLILGNSLEAVSQSAADIQQICRVRNKDIRKVRSQPWLSIYSPDGAKLTNAMISSWTVSMYRRRLTSLTNCKRSNRGVSLLLSGSLSGVAGVHLHVT